MTNEPENQPPNSAEIDDSALALICWGIVPVLCLVGAALAVVCL